MLRIVSHIEQLLLMHDCIIVPKFGGFVLQSVPVAYVEDERMFYPTRKEIVFNTTLQYNDGLLLELYMQTYHVDYRKAQLMLDEDVDALKSNLHEDKQLSLGIVGSFTVGQEGQMIFSPGEAHVFSVEAYGLPSFQFPALQSLAEVEREEVALLTGKPKREKAVTVSFGRGLMRVAVSAAAAVALFLIVSTPVKDVDQTAYKASFIPTSVSDAKSAAFEFPAREVLAMAEDHVVAEKKVASETQRAPEVQPASVVKKETPKKAELPVEVKKEPSKADLKASKAAPVEVSKNFYIVIGSFPTEGQANDFISKVDRSLCKNVSKVASNGKIRIAADKFNNRADAESYLATIRKNEKFKDAWLFINR